MTQATSIPTQTNVFSQFPPILPMAFIGTALIAMAQFGSTEKLAAAFAWLIFVAVLLADSGEAFNKLTGRFAGSSPTGIPVGPPTGSTTPGGGGSPRKK